MTAVVAPANWPSVRHVIPSQPVEPASEVDHARRHAASAPLPHATILRDRWVCPACFVVL